MTKALIVIKPGSLEHTDDVLNEYVKCGYNIVDRKTTILTQSQCDILWADLKNRYNNYPKYGDYYQRYCEYVMSGEVECIIVENETGSDEEVLNIKLALRKKYKVKGFHDLLHTSDDNEDAEREIECIF